MFDQVTMRASDRAASERFYATVLSAAGIDHRRGFALEQATDEHPPTRNLHIAFGVPARELVDRFWRAGTEAGYRDDGAPGPRPQYTPDYYGGFLLDPDGNSAEAVHHEEVRTSGTVDHLWIRVRDLGAARDRFLAVADASGFALFRDTPERAGFDSVPPGNGTFSLLPGDPTEGVSIRFAGGVVEL